jgi:hypothetical protein
VSVIVQPIVHLIGGAYAPRGGLALITQLHQYKRRVEKIDAVKLPVGG